jgi:23S rRNA pseudouridine1911/1915/1917 synthase
MVPVKHKPGEDRTGFFCWLQMNEDNLFVTFPGSPAQRLDKFLVAELPDFTRSRIQNWIKAGRVTVDGQVVHKPGTRLERPVEINIQVPPVAPSDLVPEPIPLDILYEDENLLALNKPAGLVVHPSAGHQTGTLVNAVLAHAPDIQGVGGVQRPGVVHRLDKNTSGVIVLAKNDKTHQALQDQFQARTVEKTYLALVDGAPPTPTGRIEAAIDRDTSHRQRMGVVPPGRGREAVTDYFTEHQFRKHTYLKVHPLTGRTHQIRVHLAFLGCPVAGDLIYGRKKSTVPLTRHFLHAAELTLTIPGETRCRTFTAVLPPDLEAVLVDLN